MHRIMKLTAVTILIAANVLVFLLQLQSGGALDDGVFALWPLQPIDGVSYFHILADHYVCVLA